MAVRDAQEHEDQKVCQTWSYRLFEIVQRRKSATTLCLQQELRESESLMIEVVIIQYMAHTL
jgi:hypothetical protein